jgi:hypothetical protein
MMLNVIQVLLLIGSGVIMALLCVMFGAYLMFKGTRSAPGEKFLGGVPKGEVFTISEAEGAPDEPGEEEKSILEKTEKFLGMFGKP